MAQGTYTIANQAGASFRAALNTLLGIIRSRNSGATEPSETAADMLWVDTTNGVVWRRNSADSAWVIDGSRADNPTVSTTTGITLGLDDHKKLARVTGSGGITLAFSAAATLTDGWHCVVKNDSTGNVTLNPDGTETIDGGTTLILEPGQSVMVWCDASALHTIGGPKPRIATFAATTSGTAHDWTGIPSTARRVTVNLAGVSTNGTDVVGCQVGTSSGVVTTGYLASAADIVGAVAANATSLIPTQTSGAASQVRHGSVTFEKVTGNTWVARGSIALTNAGQVFVFSGSIALAGALDRIRLTTTGGVDTFDAGSANVSWE